MKRVDKVLIAIAVAGIAGVTAFSAMYGVASQRRNAARVQMTKPASIALYDELKTSLAPAPDTTGTRAELADARDRMAEFDRVFKATAFVQNDPVFGHAIGAIGDRDAEWTDELRQAIRDIVTSVSSELDAIRALAKAGGPVFPLDFEKGPAMELPHLAPMRHLARLLAADAQVAAESGDRARILDDIEAIYGLGNALTGEPILISQLVRIAIGSIGHHAVTLLPPTGLSADDYGRVVAVLSHADYRDAFASSFAGEATGVEFVFENPELAVDFQEGNFPSQALARLYASPFAAPVRLADESVALETLSEMQSLSELPLYEARPRMEAIERRLENLSWMQPISSIMLPALTRANEAQARHEALLDLAQLGLAVEQFHDRTGAYPEHLNDVADLVPFGVPVDPHTGDPYIYRVVNGGFLLYSVNRNLTDDGGLHDLRDGDIVWRGVE